MWRGANTPPYYGPAKDKCYDDQWKPENYRHKTNEDLAGWLRNLRFKLRDLLAEKEFNADLFEKLESRYNAIKGELARRRAEAGLPDAESTRKRGRAWLEAEEAEALKEDASMPASTAERDTTGTTSAIRALLPTPAQATPVPRKPRLTLAEDIRRVAQELREQKERTEERFTLNCPEELEESEKQA